MMLSFDMLLEIIETNDIKLVNLVFVDLHSREYKVILPIDKVDELLFKEGWRVRRLSIPGWQGGRLVPSLRTALVVPNSVPATVLLTCEVVEDDFNKAFLFESASIALRAEEYLRSTGVAELAVFGLESEIHLQSSGHFCPSTAISATIDDIYKGEEVFAKAYLDLLKSWLPVSELYLNEQFADGCYVNSGEITLDQVGAYSPSLKAVVNSSAKKSGRSILSASKKPAGTVVSVSVFLQKAGENLFLNEYTKSQSEIAIFFMRGLLKHQCALSGITRVFRNDSRWLSEEVLLENSELGFFDLPVGKEANVSLALSAYLMAGLDGVISRYSLEQSKCRARGVFSLDGALSAMGTAGGFLTKGGVFPRRFIDLYTKLNFGKL